MRLESPQRILEKYLDIKFNENPSRGSGKLPLSILERQLILFLFLLLQAGCGWQSAVPADLATLSSE
jgi:hypothetical protein